LMLGTFTLGALGAVSIYAALTREFEGVRRAARDAVHHSVAADALIPETANRRFLGSRVTAMTPVQETPQLFTLLLILCVVASLVTFLIAAYRAISRTPFQRL